MQNLMQENRAAYYRGVKRVREREQERRLAATIAFKQAEALRSNRTGWLLAILWTLALVLVITLSGCTPVAYKLELGTGYNTSLNDGGVKEWENGGGVAFYGGVRAEWDSREFDWLSYTCQYMHHSQINSGAPFNDDEESSLDHVGCAYRFNLN